MENKTQGPKKCFCARCFLPVDERELVEIDGQNFHKICGTCCICRSIPTKLQMFYGHVFCEECFRKFVLARLRGESPQVHVDSNWMQFGLGVKPQENTEGTPSPTPDAQPPKPEQPFPERCVCARCLRVVNDAHKVVIGGQTFHCCCARCCCCHQVPQGQDNVRMHYGYAFCEACFQRHILTNRDHPTEFFKSCYEQWQKNPVFAEHMKMFMSSSAAHSPLVFVAPPSFPSNVEREEVETKYAAVTVKAEHSDFEDIKIEEYGVSRPNLTNPVAVPDEVKVKAELLKTEKEEDAERPSFSYNPIIHSIKRFGSFHEDEVEGGTHHRDAARALSLSAQATRSERRGGHKPTVMHGENTPRSRGRGMHREIAVKSKAIGKKAAAESSGKRKRFIL